MWYADSNLSNDQTADAEYTITRLNPRRSMVAQRSHLSDFSVLAISHLSPALHTSAPALLPRHNRAETGGGSATSLSNRQSSVEPRVKTPASQATTACVPSGQLFTAVPELMTVHRSCVELPP